MVNPIDYTMNVLDPIQGYLEGLKFGEGIQTGRLAREETRQVMGMREAQERRAQANFEEQRRARAAARAEAERQRAQAEQGQAALAALVEKGSGATTNDFLEAWVANPAIRSDLTALQTLLTEPQNRALLTASQNVYSAASQGNVEVTRQLLQDQLTAAENAGDETLAPSLRLSLQNLETDPEGTLSQLRATSAMTVMGLKGPEYIGQLNDALGVGKDAKPTEAFRTIDAQLRAAGILPLIEGGDGRYEQAMAERAGLGEQTPQAVSPIGKIAQDVEAKIIPKSVLDTAIRIEEKQGEDGLTLQQKIAEEARLRGEFVKRTEDLTSASRNYDLIVASAGDNSGAGDIALVTSFMKMLDPGSVVRETEFATARDTGGLMTKLRAAATKIEDGRFLSPDQRQDFVRLSKQYLDAAKRQQDSVRTSFAQIIDNYQLNPVNVFGVEAATTTQEEPASAEIPQSYRTNPAVVQNSNKYGVTIEKMWNAMTPEQRSRYE